MSKISILKEQLGSLSVKSALLCIIQKGAGNKCFFWGDRMWTAVQAKDTWENYLLEMPCDEFGIVRFFGGPPTKGKWYNGTIFSILCDLILFNANTQNWSTSEILSA